MVLSGSVVIVKIVNTL